MGYLVCENCKEEFNLEPDENKDNFDSECDECGGKLKYVEKNPHEKVPFCPACGAENADDAKFCKNCGKELPKLNTGICPYCAEKINPKAIKCKHCGEWLNKPESKKSKQKEGDHDAAIIVGIIFTVFGGVIGFIISLYLLTREDKKAHDVGLVLLIVNIIWIIILISIIR